jgi:type I restriction enzyme S subunit
LKRSIALRSGDAITSDSIEEAGAFPVFGGNGLRGFTDASTHEGTYVLVGRQGALCGNVMVATGAFWASEHALVAHPRHPLDESWLAALLEDMNLGQYSTSAAQPGLSADAIEQLRAPLPPLPEQRAIAGFLDLEVGKIDALVEEQRRLIALLAEKRRAVISHAVTRGLNPAAPLKPSGVDWLGDIPAHWEAVKLRHLTKKIVDGAHFTPTYVDDGVPFLRVTDISRGSPDLQTIRRIPEKEHRDLVKRCDPMKGDLLLSKNGTIGVPYVVDWDWDFSIFVSLCLIRFKSMMSPDFASYVFKSSTIIVQINMDTKQSTVTNLHLEKIAGFSFPKPPILEQIEIVRVLAHRVASLDALSTEADRAVALLLERRAALISAAVTGKIDVRALEN